ncbi:MAG: SusC/RagA family TonB-linked outer membrane protein [bacterium]
MKRKHRLLKFINVGGIIVLLTFLCTSAFGQSKDVSGTVTDLNTGETLPGVNVVVKGTTKGTITDFDGKFKLNVNNSDILVFSFMGYISEEILVEEKTDFNVQLVPDLEKLDEVVIVDVGYGTARKEDLTGAITRVDVSNMSEQPTTDASQALRGTAAGVHMSTGSRAGETGEISIRGLTTISGDNSPLIVLDGVPFQGTMADINMNDISSIDILKDGSSAAVYGSRASNGVILLTTKKGTSEKPLINFNTSYGLHSYNHKIKYMEPEDYIQKQIDYYALRGLEFDRETVVQGGLYPFEGQLYQQGKSIDPYDVITADNASVQNYDLSVAGKSDKTNFYISGSYIKDKGLIKGDEFSRITARANIETEIVDWLKIGTQSNLAQTDRSGAPVDFNAALQMSPYSQMYDSTGNLRDFPYGNSEFGNPLETLLARDLEVSTSLFALGYAKVDFPFIKGLNYRVNLSYNLVNSDRSFYYGRDTRRGDKEEGEGEKRLFEKNYILFDNILSYNREIARNHDISATLLYSVEKNRVENHTMTGKRFPDDATYYEAIYRATSAGFYNTPAENTLLSYMGRLNYKFMDKYLVTATMRRDGASQFGPKNKFAYFPSIALGWVLHKENFMQNVAFVDFLKLRVSYGRNGYNGLAPYATQQEMYSRFYIYGNQVREQMYFLSAATPYDQYPSKMPNYALKWETTLAKNIGIDYSIFKGKIGGTIELYDMETFDILLDRDLMLLTGFETTKINSGRTSNRGIEITLNTKNIEQSNFTWESTVTFFKNYNELLSLTGEDSDGDGKDDDIIGDPTDPTSYSYLIGKPLFAYYDYVTDGIVQEGEVYMDGGPQWTAGSYKFKDLNGDGAITKEDRTYIGTGQPDFMAGLNNSFTYENFTLSFFINMVIGGIIPNPKLNMGEALYPRKQNILDLDYWTPENPDAKYPRLDYTNSRNVLIYDDKSFARLQNITFSYKLPEKWMDKTFIGSAKVYLSGNNVFTFTKNYHDWDPESSQVAAWAQTDRAESSSKGGYPVPRTIIGGFNISF